MACPPDYPGWLAIFFNYHPFIKRAGARFRFQFDFL